MTGTAVDRDPALGANVVFDRDTGRGSDYYFATWHNYGKEKNLETVLALSGRGLRVLELPDTSVRGLPLMLYYLRGGSVLRDRVLTPMERYEDFGNVVVYEVPAGGEP